jgi:hypothetical protein
MIPISAVSWLVSKSGTSPDDIALALRIPSFHITAKFAKCCPNCCPDEVAPFVILAKSLKSLAPRAGLEPATQRLTDNFCAPSCDRLQFAAIANLSRSTAALRAAPVRGHWTDMKYLQVPTANFSSLNVWLCWLIGAPGTARTCNPQIRSLVLYPLSYGRLR